MNSSRPADAPRAASGQVDRPLSRPVGHEPCDLERLRAREALAELRRDDVADDPLPQRGRVRRERGDRDRDAGLGVLDDVFDRLVDHLVEGVGVLAQLRGGAGERLGDAGAELRLEDRQHPFAHAHAREPVVGVVRVVPRLEALGGARRAGRRAAHLEQRARGA